MLILRKPLTKETERLGITFPDTDYCDGLTVLANYGTGDFCMCITAITVTEAEAGASIISGTLICYVREGDLPDRFENHLLTMTEY